jgi:hypothetical protein
VDQHRKECRFLIEAHRIERAILVFHSGSAEGPDEAMCADYVRKLPGRSVADLRRQQESDALELLHTAFGWPGELRVQVFRAETGLDGQVRFPLLAQR